MSQLVAFYDSEPIDTKGAVEVEQCRLGEVPRPITSDGAIRPGVVYVQVQSPVGPALHVPFADFDEWSLRDRYAEALRIVNTLGASRVECESSRRSSKRQGLSLGIKGLAGRLSRSRDEVSAFDYSHTGTGSRPVDPRPLRWPDEPGFAAAVNAVLQNRATKVEIAINNSTQHSVDGQLGKKLKKLGFELGVSSERSEALSLRLVAEFPEKGRWR